MNEKIQSPKLSCKMLLLETFMLPEMSCSRCFFQELGALEGPPRPQSPEQCVLSSSSEKKIILHFKTHGVIPSVEANSRAVQPPWLQTLPCGNCCGIFANGESQSQETVGG